MPSAFYLTLSCENSPGIVAAVDEAVLREQLNPIASRYAMQWSLRLQSEKQRVLILVSKYDHCLVDLLYRQRIGELPMTVVGVISNHPKELHNPSLLGDIPFHHLPVTPATKRQQEGSIRGHRRGNAGRVDRARALYANSFRRYGALSKGPLHQHPLFVPAGL
jgi:formyltetrahydrofolate deformylase